MSAYRLYSVIRLVICYIMWIAAVLLTCSCAKTKTTYNQNLTRLSSTSDPIYLSFRDSKHTPFYFILKYDSTNPTVYSLHVRWNAHQEQDMLFNGSKSTLKFLIDDEIITLLPVKPPQIIAYDVETSGHQEEAVYNLSFAQLQTITDAYKIQVELTGKYSTVIGQFNRLQTFKGFKDFFNGI